MPCEPLVKGRYDGDVLAGGGRPRIAAIPEVSADPGVVVEDAATGYCGAVVDCGKDLVPLEDRFGKRRAFPLEPAAFRYEGRLVTLVKPVRRPSNLVTRTASGSVAVAGHTARVARVSRLYVEGIHDAALVERVWGDDLRIEGVVVEPLHGIDDLSAIVAEFKPAPGRRLGVLVDHLVRGSKEDRIAAAVTSPHVLITGHPYVDIWQAVKPASVKIRAWPQVPRGIDWKTGVCELLGWPDPQDGWRRVLGAVRTFADLEVPLLTAVEQLIDFVTEPYEPEAGA
jgi:hypothetical protein